MICMKWLVKGKFDLEDENLQVFDVAPLNCDLKKNKEHIGNKVMMFKITFQIF